MLFLDSIVLISHLGAAIEKMASSVFLKMYELNFLFNICFYKYFLVSFLVQERVRRLV